MVLKEKVLIIVERVVERVKVTVTTMPRRAFSSGKEMWIKNLEVEAKEVEIFDRCRHGVTNEDCSKHTEGA